VSAKSRPVFDASAVLALMQNVTGADRLDRVRKDAMPRDIAAAALDALHLEVVPFEPQEALLSAACVAKDVSLGDRCFLACASKNGIGWTADHNLGGIAGSLLPPLKMFR
jgi:PIN domain nuclease of toxin-antitoxin system